MPRPRNMGTSQSCQTMRRSSTTGWAIIAYRLAEVRLRDRTHWKTEFPTELEMCSTHLLLSRLHSSTRIGSLIKRIQSKISPFAFDTKTKYHQGLQRSYLAMSQRTN